MRQGLRHYLDVLERKLAALAGSTPLQQWRERMRLAGELRLAVASLDELGQESGTRGMIELLHAGQQHGWDG